jgi:chloramphenicol 3-O phosphotransferase
MVLPSKRQWLGRDLVPSIRRLRSGVPAYVKNRYLHGSMTRIILLNGVGSAGKSSIARALQDITAVPYLHVPMDSFLDMLPARYGENHPDGFSFTPVEGHGGIALQINTGEVAAKALRGMRRAVVALAGQGNNLIVDDVMLDDTWPDYQTLLAPYDVSLVGVFAPLAVLEERERQRGDRMIGLARWQYDRVHQGMVYDLEIDTSTATPEACARKIKQALGL